MSRAAAAAAVTHDKEERTGAEAAAAAANDSRATAEPQRQVAHGSRYVGQHDEQGRPHGFGCEVDAAGNMINGRCGVWRHGLLLLNRSFPLSLAPADIPLFVVERVCGTVLLWCNGDAYRGGLDDQHRPHGDGCVFFADGRERQQGRFYHGSLIKILLEYVNGDSYEGEWRDNQRHGEGTLIRKADGSIYEGTWSFNRFVSGQRTLPDGQTHHGDFLDGVLHGPGCIVKWPNGDRYEGTMHHGQREGDGKYTWNNGEIYEGQWKDGNSDGEGKLMHNDGSIEEGTWSEDKLVFGKLLSKLRFPDGIKTQLQQGAFVAGKLDGDACIIVAPNEDRYEGAVVQEKREGVGKQSWKESSETYDGEWRNDRRVGFGVQRRRDGKILACGRWISDELNKSCPVPRSALPDGSLSHADDALLFPDGHTFRGPLNYQHQPHGRGSMHRIDGSEESRGDWLTGALTGLGLLRLSNGDVFEGQLNAGKRKGFGALWNAAGQLLKCGEWGNGWLRELDSRPVPRRFIAFGEKLNAVSRDASLFYPSGEFFVGGLNAQDQPHGVGTLYSAHGLVRQQGVWSNGVYTGPAPPPDAHPPSAAVVIHANVLSPLAPGPAIGATIAAISPAQAAVEAATALPVAVSDAAPSMPALAMDEQMDVDSGPKPAEAPRLPAIPPAGVVLLAAAYPPRRRSALCIGNNAYAPPLEPLQFCSSDAKRMRTALQQDKFDSSVVRKDLNWRSINEEINTFIESLTQQQYGPGDLALLYFSGHGCELGTNNVYLMPTDIGCEDADQGGLSVQMLKRRFNRALNGAQVVFILDCCRVSETVNLSALYEQALGDRCEAERRATKEEAAEKRKLIKQKEAEDRQHRPLHYDDYSDSEPSQSQSSSSAALPDIRPQASIEPHQDDLTVSPFAVVFSCDTGHIARTGWKEGSIFSSCLLEQLQAPNADLAISALVHRANERMAQVLAALPDREKVKLGKSQVASVWSSHAITLAAR